MKSCTYIHTYIHTLDTVRTQHTHIYLKEYIQTIHTYIHTLEGVHPNYTNHTYIHTWELDIDT